MLMSNPKIFSVPPESKNSSMFLSLRKFGFWNIPGIFLYLSFFPFSKSLPGKIFIFSTFGLRFRRFLFLNLSKFTLYVTISVSPAYPTLWNYENTLILPVNYNSAVRTLFRTILSPKFMPPQILSTETLSNQLPLSINRPFRPPPLSHPHPPLPARFGEHFATQVPRFFIRLAGCWSTVGLPPSLLVSTHIPSQEIYKNSYPGQNQYSLTTGWFCWCTCLHMCWLVLYRIVTGVPRGEARSCSRRRCRKPKPGVFVLVSRKPVPTIPAFLPTKQWQVH